MGRPASDGERVCKAEVKGAAAAAKSTSVVSDSVRPHRRQPTRLPRPWDSPGKNTGVGCHFLLQCMKVKSESEVTQSSPILSDPMDCSLPGSSIHGIFQARVLEWGAIAFSERWLGTRKKCWATSISHTIGGTIAPHGGLLCRGPQQPLGILLTTARPPPASITEETNGQQSCCRPPPDDTTEVFSLQIFTFKDASHLCSFPAALHEP